ncbi:serine/threonine protein phosphatase [Spirochaetia bacterium]|nr:serine/threonine protein phosphatase [Spirochaetia bacterium]
MGYILYYLQMKGILKKSKKNFVAPVIIAITFVVAARLLAALVLPVLFLPLLLGGCGNRLPASAGNPGTGSGIAPSEIPLIYVSNDVHFFARSIHDQNIAERDGKNVEMVDSILQAIAYSIAPKHAIMIFNGDLSFNGERESHQELANRLRALEYQGLKVYVTPGNHDIENPAARSLLKGKVSPVKSVSPREFRKIYRDFGYGEAISRDKETLSYVAQPAPKLRLLMLDSNKYTRNRALGFSEMDGAIPDSTREWIRKTALAAQQDGALLVAAMHHSLMDHHPMVNEGFTVDDAETLRELFAELGINFILSGHIHAQEISMRETSRGPVYDIATSALSVYPHQIGELEFFPAEPSAKAENQGSPETDPTGGRWQYRVKPVDVEGWALANDIPDERLLNFKSYSEEFFRRSSEEMVKRRLAWEFYLTIHEYNAISDLMTTLNARYFAGTEYLNALDLPQSEGYRLLEEYRFEFLYNYAQTIMDDSPPSNIELSIPVPMQNLNPIAK